MVMYLFTFISDFIFFILETFKRGSIRHQQNQSEVFLYTLNLGLSEEPLVD